MTSHLVEFHEAAAAEYEAAFAWYFERSEIAAARFAEEVSRSLDLISAAPHRWPAHMHQTRRFALRHFSVCHHLSQTLCGCAGCGHGPWSSSSPLESASR